MNKESYLNFCREIAGAIVDQPFEEDFETYIARHASSRKWFAAVLRHNDRDLVNLKCDPIEAEFLRSVYSGITPGYHMNKVHWNTVYLDSDTDVPDELLRRMTMESFRLTEAKRKTQAAKGGKENEIRHADAD